MKLRHLTAPLILALALGSLSSPAAAAPADLLAAYKKEFAFLEAQKRALTARLKALDAAQLRREIGARKDVAKLSARVIGLRGLADQKEQELRAAARQAPAEDGDRLAETLERARATLAKAGFTLPPIKKDSVDNDSVDKRKTDAKAYLGRQLETLDKAFALAARVIDRQGRLRRQPGTFFNADGTRTHGQLVHLGAVASYGIAPRGSAGALAPAGEGRLKLWPADAAQVARALAAGERPATLSLFLYESLDKNIEPKANKTALSIVRAGGLIAWVIVGLGALALLLLLLRVVILSTAGARSGGLMTRVETLVAKRSHEAALALCQRRRGSLARVLAATIAHLGRARQALEDRITEAVLQEQPRLSRFSAAITVFAAVAPLLGLLGTVTGMISTFDVITEHGTGDPKLLSAGISEALITTELGLVVAIPTLLIGTLLSGWSQSIEESLERSALRVLNADDSAADDGDALPGREAERKLPAGTSTEDKEAPDESNDERRLPSLEPLGEVP